MKKSFVLRLRTHAAMVGGLLRLRSLYFVSWIGLALSLPVGGIAGQLFGAVGLALGVVLFVIDTLRIVREMGSLQVDAVPHSELVGFTVFSPDTARPEVLALKVDRRAWQIQGLHPNLEERYKIIRTRAQSGSDLTNGLKVRVCNDPDEHQEIHIRPTRYFHGLVTNEFAGFRLMRDGFAVYDPVSIIWSRGQLLGLAESPASNHLGVAVMVRTLDDRYVIQQGSRRANVGSRKANPSASGSVDWEDVTEATRTLDDLARHALLREFEEETGLPTTDWLELESLTSTGFGRIHARGGKPELAYSVRSQRRASEWAAALEVPPEPETQKFHVLPAGEPAAALDYIRDVVGLSPSHSLLFLLHTLAESH